MNVIFDECNLNVILNFQFFLIIMENGENNRVPYIVEYTLKTALQRLRLKINQSRNLQKRHLTQYTCVPHSHRRVIGCLM